jgi:amidophosphoribosyltransferase
VANSHLGKFAICTVSKIVNAEELEEEMLQNHHTFSETSQGSVNPTELIAMLIADGDDFVSGIENVFNKIKGSCSILILTEKMIIAARDKLGRTPLIIGKNCDGFAVASETCSFANLNYDIEKFLGPGEIVRITAEGYEQIRKPNDKMQVCAFLWVYYGYPPSYYEGINVEETDTVAGQHWQKMTMWRPILSPEFQIRVLATPLVTATRQKFHTCGLMQNIHLPGHVVLCHRIS